MIYLIVMKIIFQNTLEIISSWKILSISLDLYHFDLDISQFLFTF